MVHSARPTRIRYIVLGLTTLVAVMLYLDRWCLGFVAQDVGDQLRLSLAEVDLLQSSFFVTYAIAQIPCGRLADRYGPRIMLTLYLVGWSMLTGMMGLATSLSVLLLFRLGCGLFEAGAYPACAGLVRRWMPYRQRGLGSAFVSIGGRIGGAIAFPLSAYLMVAFATASGNVEFQAREIIAPAAIARQFLDAGASEPGSFAHALLEHIRPFITPAQQRVLSEVAQASRETADTTPQAVHEESVAEVLNDLVRSPKILAGFDVTPYRSKLPATALEPVAPNDSPGAHTAALRRNRLLLEVALAKRVCKLHGWGWQPTFAVYGVLGVALALVFAAFFRNWPHKHPLVNAAEAELIEGGQGIANSSDGPDPVRSLWRAILTNRSLWLCSFVQFGTNFSWLVLGTKLPEYLERVHQVPKIEQGWLLFLPYVVSVPMTMIGGGWTDWMTRRWGPWLGRAFPIASTRFVAGAACLACVFLNAPWPITLAMCVMSVTSDMGLPAVWAYNLDVGGRNVGLILGWGNMWGNLGAAISPYVLGRIQERWDWNAVFIVCAAVFALIGVASFGIDATRPINRSAPNLPQAS
jgi:sugar phosphate permease